MPFGIAGSSLVAEFSSTEGTSPYVLDGPLPRAAPFRDFFAAGEAVSYEADDQGGLIEFGTGIFGADDTISRNSITWSSTGGIIDWPEGRRVIKATVPVSLTISSFWNGTVADSEVIFRYVFAVAARIPVDLIGSQAACEIAPTNAAIFDIKLNGTTIGSIIFAQGATSATFYFSSLANCVPGDVLTISGPAVHDATIANIAFNIQAVGGNVVSVTAVSTVNVVDVASISETTTTRAVFGRSILEHATPLDDQSSGISAKRVDEVQSVAETISGIALRYGQVAETTVSSATQDVTTTIFHVATAEVGHATAAQDRSGTTTAKSVAEVAALLDFVSTGVPALMGTWAGTIGADETLMRYVFTASTTLAAGLPGSIANCVVPATTISTVLTIRKNGAAIGTITYATSAITAAISMSATTVFVPGDILAITGPSSPDATLSDLSWNLQPSGGGAEAISGLWNGTVGANNIIARHLFATSATLPTNLPGSRAIAQSPGVDTTTVFTLRRNVVNIGTLTFPIGNTIGTFSLASPASFVSGDSLVVIAPAAPDGALANLAWNIQTTIGTTPVITGEWNGTLNASETLVRYVFARTAILPAGMQSSRFICGGNASLSLIITPPNPVIPVGTPLGTTVATLTGSWGDGRAFGGTFSFAAPFFGGTGTPAYNVGADGTGGGGASIYAITQSSPGTIGYLIINPAGPGVGPNATIEDVTIVATDTMTGTATATTVFTIQKNGSTIGTATFAAGATAATFSFATTVTFVAGDILTVTSPVSPDTTLADLAWNIVTT